MTILTVGIDLANNVFAMHGVNEAGNAERVTHPVNGALPSDSYPRAWKRNLNKPATRNAVCLQSFTEQRFTCKFDQRADDRSTR